jgi:twitching motility protein PilT
MPSILTKIITEAKSKNASDIHLIPGTPITYRIDGELIPTEQNAITAEETNIFIDTILDIGMQNKLETKGQICFSTTLSNDTRIRVNIFRQRGAWALILHHISSHIPTPRELGIPESVVKLTNRRQGLILLTGVTGSGISTTLTALIEEVNKTQSKSITTIENPIEYIYQRKSSLISQREIGTDISSEAEGIYNTMKQDTDIILITEVNNQDTITAMLTAAEAGHLVFASMHLNNVISAINRLAGYFQPRSQPLIKERLSDALVGVVAQQRMKKQAQPGSAVAFEVMLADTNICNLLREDKIFQLKTAIQNGQSEGMQTMDSAIYDHYMKSNIDAKTAIYYAQNPIEMHQRVTII